MVNIIQEQRKPSFSSRLGGTLGQGFSQGLGASLQSKREIEKEFARAMMSGKMAKQQEKDQRLKTGLGTIDQMRELLKGGNLGFGSGLMGLFSEDKRRDRAQYEQLGRSLIPLVAAGVPIRNQREFEEYSKIITNPGATEAQIEGALNALEGLLSRSSQGEGDFSSKIQGENKKKRSEILESASLDQEQPDQMKSQPQQELSRTRSVVSALPKGVIESLQGISDLVNLPMDYLIKKVAPEFSKKKENLRQAEIEAVERFLPTKEGAAEDILRFVGQNIPAASTGGAGLAMKGAQALSGGLAKKSLKELGAPEWVQDLGSGISMMAPGLTKAGVSKVLKPSASQKQVVDFLRKKGLTDKQITPIIQNEKKLAVLSKVAFKYPEQGKFASELQKSLGDLYEDIASKGSHKPLTGNGLDGLTKGIQDTLLKINPRYRSAVSKDIENLFSEPVTFKSLQEFKEAINDSVSHMTGGKKSIGAIKGPIEQAMKHIDPKLYAEQKILDVSYGKMKNFLKNMTKSQSEGLLKLEKVNPAVAAAMGLKFAAMPKLAALGIAAPVAARQFLINPRLQRIHSKMWEELGKNKIPQVIKLADLFEREFAKENRKTT